MSSTRIPRTWRSLALLLLGLLVVLLVIYRMPQPPHFVPEEVVRMTIYWESQSKPLELPVEQAKRLFVSFRPGRSFLFLMEPKRRDFILVKLRDGRELRLGVLGNSPNDITNLSGGGAWRVSGESYDTYLSILQYRGEGPLRSPSNSATLPSWP